MHVGENYWFNWFFGLWTFRHQTYVGTILRVFELYVKNPAFAQQKNSSNAKGFLWRTIKEPCIWHMVFYEELAFVITFYVSNTSICQTEK